MSTLHRLTGAAYGTHLSDQIALVAVPLVAALTFDASPQMIGVLVACQSSAHLFGSIPFGVLADRKQLRTLAIASACLSFIGFLGATLAIVLVNMFLFGLAITMAGFGAVLFGLSALSILPKTVELNALAAANSAIEIPRAVCAFTVPLIIGLVISDVPAIVVFLTAMTGSVMALGFALGLPRFTLSGARQPFVLPQIVEGARYMLKHNLLLPIALCAVFWNFAFAALLVALVKAIEEVYGFDAGAFGICLSAFGLAAIIGNWTAGRFSDRISPRFILLFGPGSSVIAAGGLLSIQDGHAPYGLYASFFLLGFGPSMWLIAQNAVRQLVTPSDMLGRVNAVIQTAIYGIRPLGALIGGMVTGAAGSKSALMLVVFAYLVSFAVSLLSDLRSVTAYDDLKMS